VPLAAAGGAATMRDAAADLAVLRQWRPRLRESPPTTTRLPPWLRRGQALPLLAATAFLVRRREGSTRTPRLRLLTDDAARPHASPDPHSALPA